jgi:cytoskeletal protein CcmA (bactofilin family)
MFSKTTREAAADGAATVQPSAPAVPAPKRTIKANGVPSILSAEVVIKGMIVSAGDIQVDGKIEGDIRACSIVVGDKAVINGDVFAEEANIRGRVEGSISAHKVQLASTCRVSGNILHETLSVEAGAFFEGNCRHSDNPLADAPDSASAVRGEQRKVALSSVPKSADA